MENRKTTCALWFLFAMVLLAVSLFHVSAFAKDQGTSLTPGVVQSDDYRPVLVQLSHESISAPLWGVEDADILYECIIDGELHTRYIALYQDQYPDVVGPVRGTMAYGLSLQAAWDCPFVFVGAQPATDTRMYEGMRNNAADVLIIDKTLGDNRGRFAYNADRSFQDRYSIKLNTWVEFFWPLAANTGEAYVPRPSGLLFTSEGSAGKSTAALITVPYTDAYCVQYTYVPEQQHYLRKTEDEEQEWHMPLAVSNVVLQCMPIYYDPPGKTGDENPLDYPAYEMLGEGPFIGFVNGTVVIGTWNREAENAPYTYTLENGNPFILRSGKTFIHLLPEELYATVVENIQ